jgi:hypothetical protein
MVDVTNRANVHVRLVPLEFALTHLFASLSSKDDRRTAVGGGLRSRLELSLSLRKRKC